MYGEQYRKEAIDQYKKQHKNEAILFLPNVEKDTGEISINRSLMITSLCLCLVYSHENNISDE